MNIVSERFVGNLMNEIHDDDQARNLYELLAGY
jgi:hypothetical protein